jgi:hypothetical protein
MLLVVVVVVDAQHQQIQQIHVRCQEGKEEEAKGLTITLMQDNQAIFQQLVCQTQEVEVEVGVALLVPLGLAAPA